jgi:hypothetical protein
VGVADAALGSEFGFRRLRVDLRGYRALPQRHVLAAQLLLQGVGGAAPFDQLALIGSNSAMRGYVPGRFLPTIGAGVRFRMDPVTRATIRVDYARGTAGQGGLYVAFSEAF